MKLSFIRAWSHEATFAGNLAATNCSAFSGTCVMCQTLLTIPKNNLRIFKKWILFQAYSENIQKVNTIPRIIWEYSKSGWILFFENWFPVSCCVWDDPKTNELDKIWRFIVEDMRKLVSSEKPELSEVCTFNLPVPSYFSLALFPLVNWGCRVPDRPLCTLQYDYTLQQEECTKP